MTIRKLLVSNAIRNYAYRGTALQMSQRRFAANSSDPLDLDGDEIDEEELLQKHSQQQQQQQQQQQEDEVPQEDSADTLVQQRVYTFGSVYNGRTGNNISSTLGLTGSVPSQKPQHIEFFDNVCVLCWFLYFDLSLLLNNKHNQLINSIVSKRFLLSTNTTWH